MVNKRGHPAVERANFLCLKAWPDYHVTALVNPALRPAIFTVASPLWEI